MKSNKENVRTEEERGDKSRTYYSELPETEDSSPSKVVVKKESRKGNKENRELRILRRSKTLKEKNDPVRFSGDGINFKAKIIGTEHVLDARGNRMCQGALQRLKAAAKTSKDHKQKIILNISLNGIIIKDEKSGETLHHHPIHKISFISQDTGDNRAFGYVFGCPQTGHEFFGIKTEKIASQVVLTLRDLFLTALELKKKEIERAQNQEGEAESKPHIAANGVSESPPTCPEAATVEDSSSKDRGLHKDLLYSNIISLPDENATKNGHEENSQVIEPAVDTLLDLQFTMDSLQQGITQMDHSIASTASQSFGLSFSEDDISESSSSSFPMSFHFKLDKLSSLYQETFSISSRSSSTSDYNVCPSENKVEEIEKRDLPTSISSATSEQSVDTVSVENGIPAASAPEDIDVSVACNQTEDKYAVFLDIDALPSIFDNPVIVEASSTLEDASFSVESDKELGSLTSEIKASTPKVFAELDPLGNHPYVDKKDFFQELKNPPKKVLKDLVSSSELFPSSSSGGSLDTSFNSSEDPKSVIPVNSVENVFQSSTALSHCLNGTISGPKLNPFSVGSSIVSQTPPELPPKKVGNLPPIPHFPDVNYEFNTEDRQWEKVNPFNPFSATDYPDVPPPNSPPPPPPPRLPTKILHDIPLSPPRPPSRSNGTPTPPLPRRRSPFASSNQTWFSFDQEALPSDIPEPDFDQFAPPIPSPARKFPLMAKTNCTQPESSSASNSPATPRRMSNFGHLSSESEERVRPRGVLSRHTSILQESPFLEIALPISDRPFLVGKKETCSVNDSPPLPPKPGTISRPRPSPSKVSRVTATSSSLSGSNVSTEEVLNGTRSSSSLVFSSSYEGKMGSSSEALFMNSSETSDVFSSDSSQKTPQSSVEQPDKEVTTELSPDSIFRRKSDPFADEFFLSLPKKSSTAESTSEQDHPNFMAVCFGNLKAPT